VSDRLPFFSRLLRRFRARGVRDLRDLDAANRLGQPPRPLLMALAVFLLITLLGATTYTLGRNAEPTALLLIATVAVFGIAAAVGSALAVAEYRALQQTDRAQAELLALHADLELARREASFRLHDARALTVAMDAALHALRQSGADRTIVAALSDQVTHLQRLLTAAPAARPEPVATADVLAQVGSFAALHGVSLLHEAADDAVVLANRDQMVAILENLVDNARKYAPGSPVLVTCETAGPYLKIILEDQGPGIAAADAEALFQPGVRRGEGAQGFGMGLAIARSLAEDMGGALWYEPRSGRGSRFVLKLPRSAGEAGGQPTGAP
jgi:two-component system sensor histidine kinase KdpD